METWRVLAVTLLGVSGILVILIIMARTRERTHSAASTAVAGLVSVTALGTGCVLTLTVLPAVLAWGLAGVTAIAGGVLVLTG